MFGQIAGSLIGGMFANKAAKDDRRAMAEANRMRLMPYLDVQPYLKDFYSGGTDAFNSGLDAGYYSGDTFAGMDARTREGLEAGAGFGRRGVADASGFMNNAAGFGQNYADLYNRASQDMLGNASQYAANNVEPLLSAAMRDSRRNLEEQALPGVGLAASGTGNANSSRAGVREAILERGYSDRESDMRANLMDRLTDRSLGQQQQQLANITAANQNLAGLYDMGFGLGGRGAAAMAGAGSAFQADEQARMDDERRRFEGNRDFGMNYFGNYGNSILGRAPNAAFGSVNNNMANPTMAGLSGAMSGFGMGGSLFGGGRQNTGYFGGPFNMFQQQSAVAPSIASAGYY
jgi:hypothetical protein